MKDQFKKTWESYVSSWKTESVSKKIFLFENCLDNSCVYTDPLVKTNGWDELKEYMVNFHKQIPGAYFETTYFLAHSNKSIAKWELKNSENAIIGDGISYGEYNDKGKLIAMTGFYETPES